MKARQYAAFAPDGTLIGIKSANGWAALYDMSTWSITDAVRRRRPIKKLGGIIFEEADPDQFKAELEKRTDAHASLTAAEQEAREKGVTYGKLQAEEYRKTVRCEHRDGLTSMREREQAEIIEEDESNMKEEGNELTASEPVTLPMPRIRVKDIVDLIKGGVEETVITLRYMEDNGLILSAPDDSRVWDVPEIGGYEPDTMTIQGTRELTIFIKGVAV